MMDDKFRILVVDDNEELCANIRDILMANNYLVDTAVNSNAALVLCRKNKYNIALVDIKLPDLAGPEVVKKIVRISPQTVIIHITAYASLESAIEAVKQERVVSYETKPLDMDHLLSIIKQITQRLMAEEASRQTQEALRESEEKFRSYVETSADIVIRLDITGHIEYVSPRVREQYGYEPVDLIGKHLKVTTPIEEIPKATGALKIILKGKPLENFQINQINKNGQIIPMEINAVPVEKNGKIVGLQGVMRDITQRKQAEESIKAAQQYAQNLVDSSLDMIISVNKDRMIAEFNHAAEKTFGYTKEEIQGQCVDILYADPKQSITIHEKSRKKGKFIGEIINIRKNGETFPALISASILRNEKGEFIGVMGVSRDISKRKMADERIKASLREKEVLLKEIHHRVKNNLQVISSLLSLQSGYIKDQQANELFKDSQDRVRSMALVHDKLYRSKDLASIDFAEYIRDLSEYLVRSYETDGGNIELKFNMKHFSLSIDIAIPCGLIVNELLTNSLKHAFPDGKKGRILIDFKKDSKKYKLTISDNGTGFPGDVDFRNIKTLGLQLVNTLVEQLDGNIELQKNGGTEFRITFSG